MGLWILIKQFCDCNTNWDFLILCNFVRATLIVGKKGRREIGKCFPTKFSSLRLVCTPVVLKPFYTLTPNEGIQFSVDPRNQWRTRKFSWGGSFSGIGWSFAFGVYRLWRHNLPSYAYFQTNVLAKFVDIMCIFFYKHSPYFICYGIENKPSVLQVKISEGYKLDVTT